ncbi:HindVP family restriction endonuclease [Enterorhabdus sp. NM05_H27]|nr:HindVP family restriction endonuclease [Enterorhabdus sp. NM05_H27]
MPSFLFGLDHSNKDFTREESYGKNTFTTAFPVALSNYIDSKGLLQNYIQAVVFDDDRPDVQQVQIPLEDLLGIASGQAYYGFEDSFSGYDAYAVNRANRSDIVVKNSQTGEELCALEVKLVAVPTSSTATRKREQQCCELVVRPPSIEQLCFSVAASFGANNRQFLGDLIVKALGDPIDYDWQNEQFMIARREKILNAAYDIIEQGITCQRPLVLMGEWRTKGQEPDLDEDCFDCFFWSNLAFLQLFTNATEKAIERDERIIKRPERALIWFIKSIFDYAAQGKVTFERTHSLITFGGQTDKAGSFTGNNILPFVESQNFLYPRIKESERCRIISDEGAAMLKPERRLDAVLISLGMRDLLERLK